MYLVSFGGPTVKHSCAYEYTVHAGFICNCMLCQRGSETQAIITDVVQTKVEIWLYSYIVGLDSGYIFMYYRMDSILAV